MSTTGTFVVAGSLNLDLAFEVSNLPRRGEAVHASGFRRDLGGKGFNQAVALARLGAQVAMVGAVGRDADGDWFLGRLAELGIDAEGVMRSDRPTGLAVPVIDSDGANFIVVAPGANLDPAIAGAAQARLQGARLLLLQGELTPATNLRLAQRARELGLRVLLNPAPAHHELERCFALSQVVVVNEVEVEDFGGAERMRDLGAETVIVTLGAEGAAIHGEVSAAVAAPHIKALDTTGAGDAFCGALALRLSLGDEIQAAVRWACAAGAAACQKPGTSGSMPAASEVEALL